jgi:hypothetical protein
VPQHDNNPEITAGKMLGVELMQRDVLVVTNPRKFFDLLTWKVEYQDHMGRYFIGEATKVLQLIFCNKDMHG